MPNQAAGGDGNRAGAPVSASPSSWRRFWAWLAAVDEALILSSDEIRDLRLSALERDVSILKARLADDVRAVAVLAPSGVKVQDEPSRSE